MVRSSERLRAVAADAEIAQLLGIAPGAPLLQIRRMALAYNDLPVEFRISQVNTAGYEYFSDLGRSWAASARPLSGNAGRPSFLAPAGDQPVRAASRSCATGAKLRRCAGQRSELRQRREMHGAVP